jgi:putative ABC transport system substrate-binding protein
VGAFADQPGGDLLMIRRREFIAGLGGAAMLPLKGRSQQRAQQHAVPVIGYLDIFGRSSRGVADGFARGLAETGFIEGKSLAIEYRSGPANFERLLPLAAELAQRPVAVIVASGAMASVRAAMAATSSIPIVFQYAGDPVKEGFVASLNRPGAMSLV